MSKWPLVSLGEIFEIARGGSPRPIDDFITDAEDGVNWVSISDASESTKYINATKKKITKDGVVRSRMVHPGDFLLTNSMSFGRPYIMNTSGCIHDGWLVLSKRKNNVNQDYFYHLLGSETTYLKFKSLAAGAVVKNLNIELVKGVKVPLPPVEEQKRIAAILDKADSLRRKREQAIRLTDDFLRAVFLDMFGDPLRKAGDRVSLAKVVDIDAPMVDPRLDEYTDMFHVGPDRIEKGTGRLLECQTAREEGLISKKFLFDDSYVLYSKIRPYLRKCALATFTGLCSADMYPVRPKFGVATREFIWALLLSNEFDRYVSSLPDRANIPKLNRDELNSFEFNLPSIQEQEKFSNIVQKRIAYTNLLGSSSSDALKLANSLQSLFL